MDWQTLLGILGTCAGLLGGYYAWRALDERAVRNSQDRFRTALAEIRERAAILDDMAAELHISACPSLRRIGLTSMLTNDSLEPTNPYR